MNKLIKTGMFLLSLHLSTSIASTQSQTTLIDPENGNRLVNYENKDGFAVIEGDIIIGTVEEIQKKGAVANRNLKTRWTRGIVPYIINSQMPHRNVTYIHQAIDAIDAKTANITFVDANSIKPFPKDYIEFMPSKSTCSSWVGKIGGRQTISLAPGCYTGGTIHEITHALGLWHEQSRADRDSYVRIVWDNISESAKGNFNIVNGTLIGEYDYDSIMHYGPKAFSINGKDTIIPLKSGAKIGQRDNLSVKDVAALDQMYTGK